MQEMASQVIPPGNNKTLRLCCEALYHFKSKNKELYNADAIILTDHKHSGPDCFMYVFPSCRQSLQV